RLAGAIRRQDWFVVALEVAIVVLGVVIGFQVTAWGQERDMRDREEVQRAALREDFVANRQQLTRVLAGLDVAVAGQRELLRVMHGHSPRPDPDSLGGLVFSTVTFARFQPVMGAYDAMLSAGDLRLIRDPDLRSNLAHFAELADAGFEDEEQMTDLRVRLFGVLGENGDILSIVYPAWREGSGLPASSMTMDVDALLASPEFSTLATNMAFGEASMQSYYRRMEEHLDAVLAGLGVAPDTVTSP
ncbi:hypothetical protein, partial [Rubrivirga sp.]|uniref:hypothetical protein n=1 Tax=Rubrivirga sp. TaxID=1885344 RepID=UPI003C74509E